jgi:hypothetical protein
MEIDKSLREENVQSLSLSISIVFLVFILMSSTFNSFIIKPLLRDGSIIAHGRYMITFDALDTVEDDEGASVVAIGSSITRASIDGSCIENFSNTQDLEVYNLGLSAANPYTEMMQLTALINSKPDIVLLEAGVNSFWDIDSQNRTGGIDEDSYIEFRMRLNSILMDNSDFGNWTEIVREKDRESLLGDYFSRNNETSKYSNEAIEELLNRFIFDQSNAAKTTSWLRAPETSAESWEDYLSTPNYRIGVWDNGSMVEDWDAWFENNMEERSKFGEFNPQHSGTLFHTVMEHIVEELTRNGITVVLIATPRNPMVFDYLEPGQTDGLNSSLSNLTISDDVIVENMFWETWDKDEFLDRNHLNNNGRQKMCEILAPKIYSSLTGN